MPPSDVFFFVASCGSPVLISGFAVYGLDLIRGRYRGNGLDERATPLRKMLSQLARRLHTFSRLRASARMISARSNTDKSILLLNKTALADVFLSLSAVRERVRSICSVATAER